jgi:surface polysaccharide O-acyltransferase-like enzyme
MECRRLSDVPEPLIWHDVIEARQRASRHRTKEGIAMTAQTAMQSEPVAQSGNPKRRHELDLLRGLVVLGLIPFHAATYFISGSWAPLHYSPNPVVRMLVYFSSLVAMPLMFFIAGIGVHYSLRKRTAWGFVRNRVQRLFIPLALGHLVLLPIIQFYVFRFSPLYNETFAQFYPTFFDVSLKPGFPPFLDGARYAVHHLWFIKDLLAYTLVLLPLFLWLRSKSGQRVVEWLAVVFARPWTIFLPALPLAAIEAALGTHGDWNRFSYMVFIVYGYLLAADPRFGEALRRVWKTGLLLGVLLFSTVGVAAITHFTQAGIDFQTDPGLLSVLIRVLKGIVGWSLMIGFMGLGESIGWQGKKEKGANQQVQEAAGTDRSPTILERTAGYLSRATLPIYTVHLVFVVATGFYVGHWTSSVAIRFLVITIVSMLGTLAVYDIVRRTRFTRFLFGMSTRGAGIFPTADEQRGVGGLLRANLPRFALWTTAVLSMALIILAASNVSIVGRWEQTFDTIQPATGYIAEFKSDGTWTATAGSESVGGSYELIGDEQIKLIYSDGTISVGEYRIAYDRFGLISSTIERQQVFMRVP